MFSPMSTIVLRVMAIPLCVSLALIIKKALIFQHNKSLLLNILCIYSKKDVRF